MVNMSPSSGHPGSSSGMNKSVGAGGNGMPGQAESKQALDKLKKAIAQKRTVDRALANLEQSIYAFEGSYLSDTAASGGNIIKGFDAYMKAPSVAGASSRRQPRAGEIHETDRLFSNSSGTSAAALELLRNEELEKANRSGEASGSAQVTQGTRTSSPAVASSSANQVPLSSASNTGGSVKKRKREREESVASAGQTDEGERPATTGGRRKGNRVMDD